MDKSKAAADAVKLINQAKEDSNLQPLMIKAVCSFFDIMKGKELSQADRLFLHYLANQAGLPQYYYPMRMLENTLMKRLLCRPFQIISMKAA